MFPPNRLVLFCFLRSSDGAFESLTGRPNLLARFCFSSPPNGFGAAFSGIPNRSALDFFFSSSAEGTPL